MRMENAAPLIDFNLNFKTLHRGGLPASTADTLGVVGFRSRLQVIDFDDFYIVFTTKR